MTFLHFVNCAALALGPCFVLYKGSILDEYKNTSVVVAGVAAYLASQLIHMMLLATFVPDIDSPIPFLRDITTALTGCAHLVGATWVIRSSLAASPPNVRILGTAVGWTGAEVVTSRMIPLWIGARQIEFEWTFLHLAFQANLTLVLAICLMATAYLYTTKQVPVTTCWALGFCNVCILTLVTSLLATHVSPVTASLVEVGATVAIAVYTWNVWNTRKSRQ